MLRLPKWAARACAAALLAAQGGCTGIGQYNVRLPDGTQHVTVDMYRRDLTGAVMDAVTSYHCTAKCAPIYSGVASESGTFGTALQGALGVAAASVVPPGGGTINVNPR